MYSKIFHIVKIGHIDYHCIKYNNYNVMTFGRHKYPRGWSVSTFHRLFLPTNLDMAFTRLNSNRGFIIQYC